MQEKVTTYAAKYFAPGGYKWKLFMKAMKDWDGRKDFYGASYNIEILNTKRKEVNEQSEGYGD